MRIRAHSIAKLASTAEVQPPDPAKRGEREALTLARNEETRKGKCQFPFPDQTRQRLDSRGLIEEEESDL